MTDEKPEKKISGLRALYKRFNAERRKRFFRWSLRRSHGELLLLDRSSALDRHIMKKGGWEDEQIAKLQSLVTQHRKPGRPTVFLDVGSYFGLYSLRMRKTGLFDRICAVEANPVNFCHLQASLLLNDAVADVETFNVAVGSVTGYIHVDPPNERDRGASPLTNASREKASGFRVRATTLDDLFADVQAALLVIKMDIEGHEADALEGLQLLAERNDLILQIEIFPENEDRVFPILSGLRLIKIAEKFPDYWYVRL